MEIKCSLHIPNVNYLTISGYEEAQRDLWMVGDSFLEQTYHAFQQLKTKARDGKQEIPYMQDYYNIDKFTQGQLSSNKNVPARLVNSLVDALNTHSTKMLRIILVVPDQDLLHFINYYKFGISQIIGNCLNWVVCNMVKIIDAHKDILRHKKLGSLTASEPKIIWIKMPNCPNGQSNLLSVCGKFNNILEDVLAERKNHYIMDVNNEVAQTAYFTPFNHINDRGMETFWLSIDRMIETFDYNKDALKSMPSKPALHVTPMMRKK